eukprot:COSAG03_NODE_8789_length_771_cov_1.382440_1_plen_74_part_01
MWQHIPEGKEGEHPQAQMWRELRQLVKIGGELERDDKLPPRPPNFKELAAGVRSDHPPVPVRVCVCVCVCLCVC